MTESKVPNKSKRRVIDTDRRHALFTGAGLMAGGALAAAPNTAYVAEDDEGKKAEDAGRYGGVPIPVTPAIEASGAYIEPYRASCVQTLATPVFDEAGKFIPEALQTNVERVATWVELGGDKIGAKLYSFSEFCLQPAPAGANVAEWIKASIDANGPEIERISRAAQKAKAYVAINAGERIPQFPGRYFLSGIIVGPTGNLELNYRKLNDPTLKTRPSDVLSAWLDVFGEESLFPVADTDIGRLGCVVALDVKHPELMRGTVLKGAEVIVNPTASPAPPGASGISVSTMLRRVRAMENMAYVLLSNLGPVESGMPANMQARQPSEIIDFRGNLLADSHTDGIGGGEGFIIGTIDINALRQARTGLGSQNTLCDLQVPVHRLTYEAAEFAPVNAFMESPIQESQENNEVLRETVKRLVSRGVLVPPGA